MKYLRSDNRYIVRFEVGEKLPEKLVELARMHGWQSGSIMGLGSVKNVVLGYYDLAKKEYVNFKVDGVVEVVSLNGNLSLVDGTQFWHLHVCVGDHAGTIRGGHLMSMEVAITVECWIFPSNHAITRTRDEESGLNLLNL
jgi:uncharacterized protein